MEIIAIPKFDNNKDLFAWLQKNEDRLIAQKSAQLKQAEAIAFAPTMVIDKAEANKANEPIDVTNMDEIKVVVVINTTNLLDSYMDVHIPKLWNKSLKENKLIMHLQEHKMGFATIISDGVDLKAMAKNYSWNELGQPYEGATEALVFESTVKRNRNQFMFDQYAKGYVKNHSVGMRYVKLILCINDESAGANWESWEKYYPQIINPEEADKRGYFWAVTEAKVIEGSAVPLGANWATPTLDNNKTIEEVVKDVEEPIVEQPKIGEKGYNYNRLIENLK